MCPDLEEARRNRERIADKDANREYWDKLEAQLKFLPLTGKLPDYIPVGYLPEGRRKGRRVMDIDEEVLSISHNRIEA